MMLTTRSHKPHSAQTFSIYSEEVRIAEYNFIFVGSRIGVYIDRTDFIFVTEENKCRFFKLAAGDPHRQTRSCTTQNYS